MDLRFKEIEDYIKTNGRVKFWFISSEQDQEYYAEPGALKVCFNKLWFGSGPAYMYFSNENCDMRIDFIESVNVRKKRGEASAVVSVICGGGKSFATRRRYVFMAEPENVA